jgi:hypothetical protein
MREKAHTSYVKGFAHTTWTDLNSEIAGKVFASWPPFLEDEEIGIPKTDACTQRSHHAQRCPCEEGSASTY